MTLLSPPDLKAVILHGREETLLNWLKYFAVDQEIIVETKIWFKKLNFQLLSASRLVDIRTTLFLYMCAFPTAKRDVAMNTAEAFTHSFAVTAIATCSPHTYSVAASSVNPTPDYLIWKHRLQGSLIMCLPSKLWAIAVHRKKEEDAELFQSHISYEHREYLHAIPCIYGIKTLLGREK